MNIARITTTLMLAAALVSVSVGEEEGLGAFPDMMSGLNAVPRIGRRSLPFDMSSGFRFARGRRFGWPSLQQFRFHGGSSSGLPDSRHKREDEGEVIKRGPSPSPHPLPRPYATVKSDQHSFWEDLVSEAARNSILQKLAQAAYDKAQAASAPRMDYSGASPLARFLSRYGGSPNRPPGIYNDESS